MWNVILKKNNNFTYLCMAKEMATHSSVFAWRIPWTEDPGRLQYTGSQESDMT